MAVASNEPRDPISTAVVSTSLDDLLIPGVVVELDAREAEEIGAFEENALTEADAWEANGDLDLTELRNGD